MRRETTKSSVHGSSTEPSSTHRCGAVDQLPIGWIDEQDGGRYRLRQTEDEAYFDYVVGPHSLKNYVFPPCQTICRATRVNNEWTFASVAPDDKRIAVVGPRACDLRALAIQDRVFLEGPHVDEDYRKRRQRLFTVSVNCRRSASTCFCHSMNSGPEVSDGFDLALTELDDHFAIAIGTAAGAELIGEIPHTLCTPEQVAAAREVPRQLSNRMRRDAQPGESNGQRSLDSEGLHDLLMDNLYHPHWKAIAERCVSCANCTMVCPTCFCTSVDEVADLSGDKVDRQRRWDSCFTAEHSRMHTGSVHMSTASRYRQWLTHKLATWVDQFDEVGCVGCGRCITWCPVGIDLTAEVASLRGESP